MKKLLSITSLFFLLTLTGCAQDVCNRHSEPAGGFSLCIPAGWNVTEQEGRKYKVLHGERVDNATPNINIKDEATTASLADYAAGATKYITENYQQLGMTSMKLIASEDFMTTEGKPAIKVTLSMDIKGLKARMLQFYFDGKAGQKLIVVCTGPEARMAALDPIFERTLKSFRMEN